MPSRRQIRLLWFFILLPVILTGCNAQDAAGIKVDLSQLNWQTGVIIALALLVNPGNIVQAITGQLSMLPMAENLMRLVGLVKTADTSPTTLTQEETLEALVSIVNRLPASPLRDEIATLLTKAAKGPSNAA